MEKKPVYTSKVKEAPMVIKKEQPLLSPTAQMPTLPYMAPQPQTYDSIPAPMPTYQDCCVPMYTPCYVPMMNPCC